MSGHRCSPLFQLARQCCFRLIKQNQSSRCFSSTTAASSFRWTVLESRGVLQAEGPQALEFLQGMVSNDVRPLMGPAGRSQQPPIYATILTPKGKFLHDVFIYPHPEVQNAVLIDVGKNGRTAALQLLNRYKLRRLIKFDDVSQEYRVAAAWGSSAPPPGPFWRPDPRLPELGFRALLPASAVTPGNRLGGSEPCSEDEYRELRYRLGVAEGETEISPGQATPLDYNLDVLHGVSYTKGCYVGQERNSFTHYRGVIRRRLMPVQLEPMFPEMTPEARPGPSSQAAAAAEIEAAASSRGAPLLDSLGIEAGADILDVTSSRSVGQIRGVVMQGGAGSRQGSSGVIAWGIAYLKLDAALPVAEGKSELMVTAAPSGGMAEMAESGNRERGQEAVEPSTPETPAVGFKGAQGTARPSVPRWRVVPVRPAWWPAEWGHEELASTKPAAKVR